MYLSAISLAALVVGVDFGYQPLPDGGVQYLIQIPPHGVDALKSGEVIESLVPRDVQPLRAFRITVGTKPLPRELPPKTATADPFLPPPSMPPLELDTMVRTAPPPRAFSGAEPRAPAAPRPLAPDPASKPLAERQAAFLQTPPAKAEQPVAPAPAAAAPPAEPAQPWLPLTAALFALFASLGGNIYLVWVAWDARSRYRALVGRTGVAA